MKTLIFALLVSIAAQASEANYFRFWQGFKKNTLSHSEFMQSLPRFMTLTVDTYGKSLVNYVVAVPPEERPSFIPDEFALVAFDSKESYDTVRATPEGKAYGAAHWEVFEKDVSKSADMKFLTEDVKELEWNIAYNVLGKPIPLNNSYVTFFIGLRKDEVSEVEFRTRMLEHLRLVAEKLEPQGLKGYLALARENYEVAYLIWDSKADADKAFATNEGKAVVEDAGTILTTLMFNETKIFESTVEYQSVYKALN